MATVTYSIAQASNGYNTWSGTIIVSNLTNIVSTDIPTTITASPGSISFSPQSFGYYPDTDGNGNEYVTWRTYNGSSQYPDSGYSLDVWSTDLYNDVSSGSDWNALISHGVYLLTANKYTLIYKYNTPQGPYAPLYGNGGFITFT